MWLAIVISIQGVPIASITPVVGSYGSLTPKDIENFGTAKQRVPWALSLHTREEGSSREND